MSEIVVIYDLNAARIGLKLFERLCCIFPEGRQPQDETEYRASRLGDREFECPLPADDPRVNQLVECLAEAGFQPRQRKSPRTDKTYELER